MNHAAATIRDAIPETAELRQIAAIMEHYVRNTVVTFAETAPDVQEWEQRCRDLEAHGLPFLVAEDHTGVVGFAYVAPWRPKAAYRHTVEDTIYVAPSAAGRGIGKALLSVLIERAGVAGCRQMVAVVVDTGNPASAELHRRLGFEDVGRLKEVGFKHDQWLDTVLMQRRVGA
ncbi:GNAT family N-acetyltransferase [Microbacterium halophytorum]|uniref:GNAT family N-acetyltransferase n=1 Tax=Microbacterium halophytorum TaxID=2067568 RepID=UPI000CFD6A2B|nr:GNAT family N-acetyltransferase [Microbacterium halophytorum]